jgi:hypothetical protein
MTTITKTLTLIDVLDHLHPLPGPYLQRLVYAGPASDSEDWLRLYNGRWEALGGHNPGSGPGIPELLAQNQWCRIRFSPNLSLVQNVSEMAPCEIVALRVPLPLAPPERIEPPVLGGLIGGFGSYDDLAAQRAAVGLAALRQKDANDAMVYDSRSAEGVMARLRSLDPQPTLAVLEHDAIVVFWRLTSRIIEQPGPGYRMTPEGLPVPTNLNLSRFGLLHHRLALVHGGDCNAAARPFMLLCDAPGTKRTDIRIGAKPAPVVSAEIWNDEAVSIEALEALAVRSPA